MSAKLCPLNSRRMYDTDGGEHTMLMNCREDYCAWWHGGMCDVSRIALQLCFMTEHITDDQITEAKRVFGGDD